MPCHNKEARQLSKHAVELIEPIIIKYTEAIFSEIYTLLGRDAEVGKKWRENSSLAEWFPLTAEELERTKAALAAANAKLAEFEQVAVVLAPDPCDERDGMWLSAADRKRLDALPVGTELYARKGGKHGN